MNANISRREFAAGLGGIVVAFTLAPKLSLSQQPAALPGSGAGCWPLARSGTSVKATAMPATKSRRERCVFIGSSLLRWP